MHEHPAVSAGRPVASRTAVTVWAAAAWTTAVVTAVHLLTILVPALAGTPGGALGGAVAALAAVIAACWVVAGHASATAVAGAALVVGGGRPPARGVPRHRDPDAAGRPRPRAPSALPPAA